MNKNDKNSFENYEKKIEQEFENSTIFNSDNNEILTNPKKKTNTYTKLLCGLLCLLLVLGGSIFSVVKFWPVKQENENVEPTTPDTSFSLTSSANVSLKSMKNADENALSNVLKIVIKNETDEFVCVPFKTSDKEVKFKLQGVSEEIPINFDFVTGFYDSLFTVTAISKLDSKYSAKDCGLDNPVISVAVTMADGSEFDIKVGDPVATNDGYYYVSTSLKEGIYIAEGSVYEDFSATFDSLIDTTIINQIVENDDNKDYFSNGTLSFFDEIKLNGKNFDNVVLDYKQSEEDVLVYFINQPVKAYADDEKITTILSPFANGLSASGIYKVEPEYDDLKKFGLDNPYLEMEYKINNSTYDLKISKPGVFDNNYCACVVDDVPVIFMVMSESIPFIEWNIDNLRYNLLYLKSIELFKNFNVSYNNKTYKYEMSFNEVVTEDSSEKELTVVLNSSPIDTKGFKTCYQRLTMASVSKFVGENVYLNTEPTLKYEIELENGDVDVITFTKYNENYYLYQLNGIGDGLIPTRTVESLIYNYEQLRQGKEVVSPNNQQ